MFGICQSQICYGSARRGQVWAAIGLARAGFPGSHGPDSPHRREAPGLGMAVRGQM